MIHLESLMYKDILVNLSGRAERDESLLTTTCKLAAAHGGRVYAMKDDVSVSIAALPYGHPVGAGVGTAYLASELNRRRVESQERVRAWFSDFVDRGRRDGTASMPNTVAWLSADGLPHSALDEIWRRMDLMAFSQPEDGGTGTYTFERAPEVAIRSGRPVLLCPAEAPPTLGKRVLVAWNGSRQMSLLYPSTTYT